MVTSRVPCSRAIRFKASWEYMVTGTGLASNNDCRKSLTIQCGLQQRITFANKCLVYIRE